VRRSSRRNARAGCLRISDDASDDGSRGAEYDGSHAAEHDRSHAGSRRRAVAASIGASAQDGSVSERKED